MPLDRQSLAQRRRYRLLPQGLLLAREETGYDRMLPQRE